jgi:predicted phosphodiesterase
LMAKLNFETPVLVFGGPYSNLRATEAMRAEAERRRVPASHVICTGDVVAYCAEPDETTRLVRDWGCHVIAGNCEEQLAADAQDCGCGFEEGTACDLAAKGWYPFANQRMSAESRAWMQGLPSTLDLSIGGVSARVIHGGTSVVNKFVFASQSALLKAELAHESCDLIIAGHCGIPFTASVGRKTWFNAGVIGMPANDGTADVWYGMIEPVEGGVKMTTHRLAYDHRAAAASMRRWAYADGYATSLITGIWPSFDVLPATETAATGKKLRSRAVFVASPGVARAVLKSAS